MSEATDPSAGAKPPSTPPAPPAPPQQPAPPQPSPKPPTSPPPPKEGPTEEELIEAKVQARLSDERERDRQRREREAAKAKEEADKEQGKWQGLYEKADARAKAAELGLRREQLRGRLRDHIAAKHPEYAVAATKEGNPPAVYIWGSIQDQITAETADADADKLFARAAEQYVADNPRAPRGSAAAPAAPSGVRQAAGTTNRQQPANGNPPQRREPTIASARF